MNILQILPELNVGGVETGTVDFARYLVQNSHRSIVVSNGGQLVADLENSGSKHYTLPVHKKSILSMWRMVKPLRRIIVEEKVDIVHARSRVPAWIAFFACRSTNAQFITTCHGHYGNFIFSQVMGWAKIVIVPSEAIGRHMIDAFKVSADKIRKIPRGVNLNRFQVMREIKEGKPASIVAIVGRITPLKGHTYFIQAMAKVIRNMPYVKVWIIGDAPAKKEYYRHDLDVLVRRMGLVDHVEFFGNRSDVPELLSKVDVLVMSSVEPESFGRTILEAQAVGVPVVATRVGGVVDIIDPEKTGLLVTPKDINAMATAVMRLLKDPQLSQTLVEQARQKLHEQFTIEHMASRTLEVYDELMRSMHLLVIKLSSIGDVALITASLKALRKKFKTAKISCLVGKESRKVLQNCPYLDELIVYDQKADARGFRKLLKLAGELRNRHFDKVIDFQNNKRSHLLAGLILPRESYGFDNGKWSKLLTNPVKDYRQNIPPVQHQFQILEKLGISYQNDTYLELWPSEQDERYIQELLDSEWLGNAKNIIGINIAASEKWETKNWPVEHIAKLCDLLSVKNLRTVITGVEKDRELAQRLVALTKSKPAIIIGKTDIMQLAALIKRCKVYITPDSAPLHLAASVATPVIALFGPTSSVRHMPPAKDIVIFERKLTCSPCYSARCKILTHACMKDITPEQILQEVDKLMGVRV